MYQRHLSRIIWWIIIIYVSISNLSYKFWNDKDRIIVNDVISYYQYLPAAIIYKDISLAFWQRDPQFFNDKIWAEKMESGRYVGRMTMGLAIMYSPFFLPAHVVAAPLGYPADGYSAPYRFALIAACVFYLAIGLYFLRKILRRFFDDTVVSITLLAVALGTNLYFYAVNEPGMSHAFNFCLFAIFLFLLIRFLGNPNYASAALLGLTGGMIVLVRPSNGIILVLIPLWEVGTWKGFIQRIRFLVRSYPKVILMAACFIIILIPQLLYWKYTTGHYLFYSYGDEGFFFNHPRFINGLFSYRKGWLVYTPIMIFALAGLVVALFTKRAMFYSILVFTILNLYIIFSWWSWWYGGSFGQRSMIDSYAILALPFAAFTEWALSKRRIVRPVFIIICSFLIFLNLFQTRQYYFGSIHWDSMSKAAYWDSFLRLKPSGRFQGMLQHPDYEKAKLGIDVAYNIPVPLPVPDKKDTVSREEYIRIMEDEIRNNPGWYEEIRQKAEKWNQPVDTVIHNDAVWLWEQKEKEH
jgi:hypothetical protein